MEDITLKLSKKLMILSLFLIMVCCLGSVSATEEVSDNVDISDDEILNHQMMMELMKKYYLQMN